LRQSDADIDALFAAAFAVGFQVCACIQKGFGFL
jgi:hypothetical protein